MKGLLQKTITLLFVATLLLAHWTPIKAQEPFANCRLGIGGVGADFTAYNTAQLNIGLFSNWWVNDPVPTGLPQGVEFIQTVRVHQAKEGSDWWGGGDYVDPPDYKVGPSLTRIAEVAANRPGSLWIIGNEPDRRDFSVGGGVWRGQDETTPEVYATAFHEIRQVIREADPTARIGMGSVVQGSPLRLKYLDRVWDSHLAQYGYPISQDVDVWTTHGFILRERSGKLGADIPSGLETPADYEPEEGFLYDQGSNAFREAHHDIENFKMFTRNLRQWLADHGERDKPLINTEYGILYKNLGSGQITDAQVGAYLQASFDFLLNATDEEIGYPPDENRLVQGWVWYSLNDDTWNGQLFDTSTTNLTSIGQGWKDYVTDEEANSLAAQPQPDLWLTDPESELSNTSAPPTGKVTATLTAMLANSGNTKTATGDQVLVTFWDGPPESPESNKIGSKTVSDLPGCGHWTTVSLEWSVGPGDYEWYVTVDPTPNETDDGDNVTTHSFSVTERLPAADLAITKTVDDPTPTDTAQYEITVTNNGPDPVTEVTVQDVLPGPLTLEAYTATVGSYDALSGTWPIGTLTSGAEALLTMTVSITGEQAGQVITNQVTVTSANRLDSTALNDTASVDIVPEEETLPETPEPSETPEFSEKQIYLPLILK